MVFPGFYNLTATRANYLKWTLNETEAPAINFNDIEYSLLHIDCHTGSEHTVDDLQYPGECHLVYNCTNNNTYLAVGIFLKEGSTPNSALSDLITDLPENDE